MVINEDADAEGEAESDNPLLVDGGEATSTFRSGSDRTGVTGA